jgi:hypothetical protein
VTEPEPPIEPPAPEPLAPEPESSAEPEPTASGSPPRAYALPTARDVVVDGLQLAYSASGELQRASLYIGLLTLGLLAPPIVYAIEFLAHFHIVDMESFTKLASNSAGAGSFLAVIVLLYLGLFGWLAVTIDAQLIAVALLGARASDRPFSLREATIRARQVFWRLIRGGVLVGLVVGILNTISVLVLVGVVGINSVNGFIAGLLTAIVVAPLGYLATGVVLGDVGAREALKRSIGLARARPSIAVVVALFTVLTSAIQTFALSAGLDLFVRVGSFLHASVSGGVAPLVLTMLGLLAFVTAFGSLTFTVAAIVSAPQVAAFLGLTYYSAGLDRARDVPPTARKFRWVTRPMLVVIVLVVVFSVIGISSLPPAIGA